MKKTLPYLTAIMLVCLLSMIALWAQEQGSILDQQIIVPGIIDVKAPSVHMYTDKMVYLPGDVLSIKLSVNANGNPNPYYSYFFYLEDLETGDKRYHPGYIRPAPNSVWVTDMFGNPADPITGYYPLYSVPTASDVTWVGPGGYLINTAKQVPSIPGSYRYVMELRDLTGTNVMSRGYAPFTVVEGTDVLSGSITADQTLTSNRAYILSGMVFVEAPATLTIEAGTIIFGETTTLGGLCITQGAKIRAIGTARRPVVFTSLSAVGQRSPGDWFGIAIAGNAPINVTGGTAQVEGIETVTYGGNDPEDDSGIMRYVRLEYAGIKFDPTHEANGLYLNGVGSKTVLEYLHFNKNSDDNIEFFGGTANVKYLLCTGGEDDQLDWTEGFGGKAQFVIVQVFPNTGGNRGIEGDNWEEENNAEPRSSPTIYNMTILGPRQNYSEGEGKADHGLMLRRGTGGNFHNFIVTGYGRDAINIRDQATIDQGSTGGLVFDNAILFENGVFGPDGAGSFGNAETQNMILNHSMNVYTDVDPMLVDPFNHLTPDYRPGYMSPALKIELVKTPPDDGFFTPVDFIGGIGPSHNWLEGGWAYITEK